MLVRSDHHYLFHRGAAFTLMFSPDIQILIPCHSLEDFPTEQTDEPAASLLNAFAVAFHPALLAWSGEIPRWRRADDPPLPRQGQLVLIPMVCDGWLPHGWPDEARQAGATVVSGLFERQKMLDAALLALGTERDEEARLKERLEAGLDGLEAAPEMDAASLADLDPDLVSDFLSLGTCWLLIELLTRKMRQFGNVDESRFFQKAQAAAKAAIADDRETCETHLRACFEMLLEARERFYPVECYLLDLCLAVPDIPHESLLQQLQQPVPWSLMVGANDLKAMCDGQPPLQSALNHARTAGHVGFVGGEDYEAPLPLLPLESVLFHFAKGIEEWQSLLGHTPVVWGRRKFGLSALLPQILVKNGFSAALHVVLDDGIYPDAEYTKLRWRGVDGTLIDALSRIPLAAEGASSYLRLPTRMAESMDHDQVAGLILARWPDLQAPWFEDLRRSQKYAPCLGRFVTLDRFFETTELPGQLSVYKSNEYFSPFLIQHVARREQRPISRYADHALQRRQLDAIRWYDSISKALLSKPIDLTVHEPIEKRLESSIEEPDLGLADELNQAQQSALAELARIIMHSAGPGRGLLLVNSLSFPRRVIVQTPGISSSPTIAGAVKAVDFDPAHPEKTACVVDLPGCGYAWIPLTETGSSPKEARLPAAPKLPLAEQGLLRNDLFEVAINERTGGIAHIRFHNQRTKRLSQQLSYRFPRERTIVVGEQPAESVKSHYAEMRCLGQRVVHNGTAKGEIETFGEIFDQAKSERLASFRQTVRVWRACPTVEIEIVLSDVKEPEGDPWNNYFASRFAWNDATSAITRSIYHSAQPFGGERFETSDYVEIASETERLTIVPHGLPFHRRTSDRMVDSLLLVAGESQRRFRFTIAVDAPYPLEATWNATTPVTALPTESGPPGAGSTGWFLHSEAKNVQITRLLDISNSNAMSSPLEEFERPSVPPNPGFALRLVETEGRSKSFRLRCFRQPTYARKRDFRGLTLAELTIEGDSVLIEMSANEIVDVELRFGVIQANKA
jgi:alpha-mannosidase